MHLVFGMTITVVNYMAYYVDDYKVKKIKIEPDNLNLKRYKIWKGFFL